jgi:SAM-dependent methyltransferase
VGSFNEQKRDIWVRQTLAGLPQGLRILDAGAGEQPYRDACSHLDYVSHDFSQYDGIGDNRGLQTGSFVYGSLDIVSDINSIPEPNESFGAVLCTEVLEHVPDPVRTIAELARLLRPDGHLIITAPFASLTHFAPYHFYTGFTRHFYEAHLPANDLQLLELSENGNYFEYIGQELRRIRYVARRYSTRRLTIVDQGATYQVLRALNRLTRADVGSAELLHFGYHVHALKIAA